MFTFAGVASIVIFLVVAFSSYRNGLYSTVVVLFVAVLSGAAALMCLGPLPGMMVVSEMGGYAPPICYLGIFLLSFLILQTLASFLYPPRLTFPKAVDAGGGAAVGLVNALFVTGALMVGFALFPGTGDADQKVAFLRADEFFVRTMAIMGARTGSVPIDTDPEKGFLARAKREKYDYRPKERTDEEVYDENYKCAQRLTWLGQALQSYVDNNRKYPDDIDQLVPKDEPTRYLPRLPATVKPEDVKVCPATRRPYRVFPVPDPSIFEKLSETDRFILLFDAISGPYGHLKERSEFSDERYMGKRSVYLKNGRVEWVVDGNFRGLYQGQLDAAKAAATDTKTQ